MIEVRSIASLEEIHTAVQLQKQIWGFAEVDILPVRLFVVATKIGGDVLAAFDDSRMIGFCLALPGMKPRGLGYWHSNMMGVLAEYRNRGVGRLLKLKQREKALAADIPLIEWTFDPLEIKNAFFNIERLGAVVRRYVLNQYGTTSSHLHGGLPTDRCVAEWHLGSARVTRLLRGEPHVSELPAAQVEVPVDVAALKGREPVRARQVQESVSAQFVTHLAAGLAVTGFRKTKETGVYLFSQWPSA